MKEFNFKNKNVVILLKSFVLGGAEKQALFLASYLEKNLKCNVYIYSIIPKSTQLFYDEIKKYNLKNIYQVPNPLSSSGSFKYIKRRVKIVLFGLNLRKHKPDIIIPYLNPPSIIASLCYKISGAKIAFWHHRGPDYYRGDLLEKKAALNVPFFIGNSNGGKNELIKKFKIKKDNFHFLSNFSTIERISTFKSLKELNELPKDTTIIGMIAHFRSQKHQHLLVEAFSKVLKKHSNIHLVLAGNIYTEEKEHSNIKLVRSIISRDMLQKRVSIINNANANEILPYLDIGVLVSEKEGMPNSVMEYMEYSLPVVVTKHDGCVSLLGENYEYFVEKKSIVELTTKLNELLNSKEKMNLVGDLNKARLNEFYNIDLYINKLEEIINNHV